MSGLENPRVISIALMRVPPNDADVKMSSLPASSVANCRRLLSMHDLAANNCHYNPGIEDLPRGNLE